MTKRQELNNATSCLNKAKMKERIFVLLERDVASPATIRFWCEERIRLGKNLSSDLQIISAMCDADEMEKV